MKFILSSIFLLILISCSNKSENKEIPNQSEIKTDKVKSIITGKMDLSEYYTELDTIRFNTERGNTCSYEKAVYNNIIDKHPEFFERYPSNPERSYNENYDFENFGSEVGQDNYYVFYAHFLKMKNGEEALKKERKRLIDIYTYINSIFQRVQYGGTYFGHQYYRILGFAEYSIYRMPKSENKFRKTYDISKQKSLYIKSLRQLAIDENSIDMQTLEEAKKRERLNGLNQTIEELEKLITNIYYLRCAQQFQYEHYTYY